jgi:hypothetical protein
VTASCRVANTLKHTELAAVPVATLQFLQLQIFDYHSVSVFVIVFHLAICYPGNQSNIAALKLHKSTLGRRLTTGRTYEHKK